MLYKLGTITTWNALLHEVEQAYKPSIFECPQYALYKLSQKGFVADYHAQFNALVNRVEGISLATLLN